MGVPSFYSWLTRRYPMSKYPVSKDNGHKVDFLYLDMNQVIYKCATNPNVLFRDYLRDRNFEEVWTTILNYINDIINLMDPQQLLFMAFDGVAPRAKSNQQRARRFASGKNDEKIQSELLNLGFEHSNLTFKNNQITPGTEFMHELNQQVRYFLHKKFAEDQKYNKLKVIFSGSDVPGEGEHKMLQFIRNLRDSPDFDPQWTHVIYGADADLIMLGLATHIQQIGLLREQMNMDKITFQVAAKREADPIQFEIINLQIVRECLLMEYSYLEEKMNVPFSLERIIDDFLLVFFFVGNDFLPRVFCFDIRQGTVELLIKHFKEFLINTSDYVTNKGVINWPILVDLMARLGKFEIKAMECRADELRNELKNDEVECKQQLQQELNIIEELKYKYSNNENAAARIQFYTQKCDVNILDEQGLNKITNMVQSYLEGIQFVLSYYYKGVPSWEWFYPFYYSPLCSDIHLYLMNQASSLQIQFKQSQPFEPFKSLLLILAPTNKSLLPPIYAELLNQNSKLREPFDYYPSNFEIDPFGAIWEHQFIAKIPFMDMQLLTQVYESIDNSSLTQLDKSRNSFGQTYLYYNNDLKKSNGKLLKSLLPSVFSDSVSHIVEQPFNSDDKNLCKDFLKLFKKSKTDLVVFPSLKIQKISKFWLEETGDKRRHSKKLNIKLEECDLTQINEIEKLSHLKKAFTCYAGYPQSFFAEVILVATKNSTMYFNDFKEDDVKCFRDEELRKDDIFYFLLDMIEADLAQLGISLFPLKAIAVVNYYTQIFRKSDSSLDYSRMEIKQQVLPFEFLSNKKLVDLWDYKIENVQPLHVSQQVICFCPNNQQLNGCTGTIKSIEKDSYVIETSKLQPLEVGQLTDVKDVDNQNMHIQYYTLKYVGNALDCKLETILFILGTVKIMLNEKNTKTITNALANAVDIGFNVINRAKNMLVPELVRIYAAQQDAEGYEKYLQYRDVEISQQLFDDLKEYKNVLPKLFSYLNSFNSEAIKAVRVITVKDILRNEDNGVEQIMKAYIWLLRRPTSQYILCNVASKTISSKLIKQFEKTMVIKQIENQTKSILAQSTWLLGQDKIYIPPVFSEHPPIHQIGDRVVALNNNSTKFGSFGTVVGIIDQGQINVEVLWDEPRFGLSNLGGKCSLLRGSLVKFMDVFNLTQNYADNLAYLYADNRSKVWDRKQKIFVPKFQDSAIDKKQELM